MQLLQLKHKLLLLLGITNGEQTNIDKDGTVLWHSPRNKRDHMESLPKMI